MNSDPAKPVNARLTAFTLMFGNFVTGLSIMGLAGMLGDLAAGLGVTIRDAGLLITFGAVVLCFGSPLMVWATSTVDRRKLLAVALVVIAVGQGASALAPDYWSLLIIRVVMLSLSAVFTPVAASTITMVVAEKDRASAISFVFLGWSLAVAVGLPIVTFIAAHVGWRETYATLSLATVVALALLLYAVPSGLRGTPLSLRSWAAIGKNPLILLLLLITVLWTSGQFVLFPYLGPLIVKLGGGGTGEIGLFFAAMGIMGFLGNVTATKVVMRLGTFRTGLIFLLAMFCGTLVWAFGAGALVPMGIGVVMWGVGFAAFNSMQQARLVATAPALASATVSLNTSGNYVGQAIGSGLGGWLFARDLLLTMGYLAAGFMLIAVIAHLISGRLR
jgi:predicted MFS family arabinose efflux permease